MPKHPWNPGSDSNKPQDGKLVQAWYNRHVGEYKALWDKYSVGGRVALIAGNGHLQHALGLSNDELNCYQGQGQLVCDKIGVTYEPASTTDINQAAADEAKIKADAAAAGDPYPEAAKHPKKR